MHILLNARSALGRPFRVQSHNENEKGYDLNEIYYHCKTRIYFSAAASESGKYEGIKIGEKEKIIVRLL